MTEKDLNKGHETHGEGTSQSAHEHIKNTAKEGLVEDLDTLGTLHTGKILHLDKRRGFIKVSDNDGKTRHLMLLPLDKDDNREGTTNPKFSTGNKIIYSIDSDIPHKENADGYIIIKESRPLSVQEKTEDDKKNAENIFGNINNEQQIINRGQRSTDFFTKNDIHTLKEYIDNYGQNAISGLNNKSLEEITKNIDFIQAKKIFAEAQKNFAAGNQYDSQENLRPLKIFIDKYGEQDKLGITYKKIDEMTKQNKEGFLKIAEKGEVGHDYTKTYNYIMLNLGNNTVIIRDLDHDGRRVICKDGDKLHFIIQPREYPESSFVEMIIGDGDIIRVDIKK